MELGTLAFFALSLLSQPPPPPRTEEVKATVTPQRPRGEVLVSSQATMVKSTQAQSSSDSTSVLQTPVFLQAAATLLLPPSAQKFQTFLSVRYFDSMFASVPELCRLFNFLDAKVRCSLLCTTDLVNWNFRTMAFNLWFVIFFCDLTLRCTYAKSQSEFILWRHFSIASTLPAGLRRGSEIHGEQGRG